MLVLVLSIMCLSFFGCAGTHRGSNIAGVNQTNVNLDGSNNFKYVRRGVTGQGQSIYVLGIGGMRTNGIVGQARKDLLRQHELQANQAMVNVTYESEVASVMGVWHRVRYIMTADIIEFTE